MKRQVAFDIIKNLTELQKEAIAKIIQTADIQGNYYSCDENGDELWTDSVKDTLHTLAEEIRKLK